MIKNLKDVIIIVLAFGLMVLLGMIVAGDFYIAMAENRSVDESVINLLKWPSQGLWA